MIKTLTQILQMIDHRIFTWCAIDDGSLAIIFTYIIDKHLILAKWNFDTICYRNLYYQFIWYHVYCNNIELNKRCQNLYMTFKSINSYTLYMESLITSIWINRHILK